ncbi:MAG: DUF4268 domain-containing protein [Bacteroides sp.]|nr:DUF4268 domain-containing protein [Bacteroides sp.]
MPEYRKLQIGDMSDNGQITIVDEDRLCYIVKSESRGASGLRTISKALLDEYIQYVEKHPHTAGNDARDNLSGLTGIDKYEYGYNSTLVMMAKMVLGYVGMIEGRTSKRTITKHISSNLQQIYYGAPGTGKSHIINEQISNESVIRTTFHPDSDYSTFVGCYKPTTKVVKMRDLAGHVIRENGAELTEDRIVYEFVEQAFLQAYIQAWKFYDKSSKEVKKQFLVIEEINRGNCAQIFGDLFQLLDRNMWGFSDYPIQADNDMRKQLAKAFSELEISQENKDRINACYNCDKDYVKQVLDGKILLLPDNLYIWATMNTSDQSLFPIDSAFKRRWDWQYMPIAKGRDEQGKELNWSIEAEDNRYDWWSFLTKINEQIGSTTNSEDKKLGFFFCKAVNGKISAETFVGKVIFYLWNDVFKDFGFDNTIFNDEDGGTLSFDKFYTTNDKGKVIVRKDKVEKFLMNLGVELFVEIVEEQEEILEPSEPDEPEEPNEVDEHAGDAGHTELDQIRYKYWGDFLKYINQTEYKYIFKTENRNPVYKKFYDFGIGSSDTNLYIGYDKDVTVVGYWVKDKSLYDKFVSYKTVIEQRCGELKWIPIKKACKIIKEIPFRGKTQEEQFKLLLDEIVRMRELFIQYIK